MPKPPSDPTWATNASYDVDADPWAGADNKIVPPLARRQEGVEPDTFPAEWFNYHLNTLGEHIEYIHDVLQGADTITFEVRSVWIPAIAMPGLPHPGAISGVSSTHVVTGGNSILATVSIGGYLPSGAELSGFLLVKVKPGAARGATRMTAYLTTLDGISSPASDPTSETGTSVFDNGTTDIQTIAVPLTGLSVLTKDVTTDFNINIRSGDDGGSHIADRIYGVQVFFVDPGPRNF